MNVKLEQLERLLEIIDRLRAPDGCPWDRKQSVVSLAPFVLEEAYELVDAIGSGESAAVCEELGDLLMVLLMICRIGEEGGAFDAGRAARGIADKLVRRHPHVFGDAARPDAESVPRSWEEIKREEKAERGIESSALDGIPAASPALQRAVAIGRKAAAVGFEWPDRRGPAEKIQEELAELLQVAEAHPEGDPRIAEELGDLLFSVVNLARHLQVDPELALRGTVERFTARFRHIEAHLDRPASEATLEELEALWQQAKRALAPAPGAPIPGSRKPRKNV